MLKERRRAAEMVATDFLNAERMTDEAAIAASVCIATMLRQRSSANLPFDTGLEAIRLVTDAQHDIVRARERLIEAHRALSAVRAGIGLPSAYGDEFECPEIAHGSIGAGDHAPLRAVA